MKQSQCQNDLEQIMMSPMRAHSSMKNLLLKKPSYVDTEELDLPRVNDKKRGAGDLALVRRLRFDFDHFGT